MESIVNVGQACRKCGTAVVKKVPRKRSPKKAYWYEWYLGCQKCGTMYMVEDAKIINPHYKRKEKPEPAWKAAWLAGKETKAELDAGFLRNFQALDRIATAPKMATADTMRAIAKKALDGSHIQDSPRLRPHGEI